ncbi:MAG: hypothetical protein F7C07_02690 [Desulfurococcales archaeon]|nr:hypothetical protein [Desulfurococcales archaeon]
MVRAPRSLTGSYCNGARFNSEEAPQPAVGSAPQVLRRDTRGSTTRVTAARLCSLPMDAGRVEEASMLYPLVPENRGKLELFAETMLWLGRITWLVREARLRPGWRLRRRVSGCRRVLGRGWASYTA